MSIFKKLVSILLAAVLVFSILPGTSVPVYAVDGDGWSMGATYRVTNILSGNTGTVGPILNFHAVNGHIAYCIDPTVAEGSGYSQYSSYWEAIKTYYPEQYELIVKAVYCGYPESIQANDTQIYNSLKGKYYERDSLRRQGYKYARAATQIVIFWIICGIIRQDGNGDLYWGVSSTNDLPFLGAGSDTCVEIITDIIDSMSSVSTGIDIPSFANRIPNGSNVITLDYNPSTGNFSKTVTDTNSVLSHYAFEEFNKSGLSFSRNGNSLTITATPNAVLSLNIPAIYEPLTVNNTGVLSDVAGGVIPEAVVCWGPSGSGQSMIYYDSVGAGTEQNTAYLRLYTGTGSLVIQKSTSDNTSLHGFEFAVTGPSFTSVHTATTNAAGQVELTGLIPGTYSVQEINVPAQYSVPEAKNVSVTAGNAVTVSVMNTLKQGSLKIYKTVDDGGSLHGFQFRVVGPGYPEGTIITTDASGEAQLNGLEPGSYTITEINVPSGYNAPSSQTVNISASGSGAARFLNTSKKGGIIIRKSVDDGGTLNGFQFRITGPSFPNGTTVTTDAAGEASLADLIPGNYTVSEINVPDHYIGPDEKTVTVTGNSTVTVSVSNIAKVGNLLICKTVDDDGPLNGFEFQVKGPSYPGGTTVITDASGEARLMGLIPGIYTITEMSVPETYYAPESITVNITGMETAAVSVTNHARKGSLTVYKSTNDGSELNGFQFQVSGPSYPDGITITTDASGEAILTGLKPGVYAVSEINVPGRYEIPAPQTVNVSANRNESIQFENRVKLGSLVIRKTTEDDGLLNGFQFLVKGPSCPDGITRMTDGAGEIRLDELMPGSYSVEEVNVPEQYHVPPSQTVTVETDTTVTVVFHNSLKKGGLTITKAVSDEGSVEGFEFKITGPSYPSGKVVTTNESGVATLEELVPGTYIIEEINVPARYVVPDPQTVLVKAENRREVSFENVLCAGNLLLHKHIDDGTALDGFEFTVTGPSFPSGTTIVTDASGEAFLENLVTGEYLVHEINIPAKYNAPEDQTVTVVAGRTSEVSISNTVKVGELEILKTAEDDNQLQGFQFAVSGPGFPNGTTVSTNSEGRASLSGLLPGTYTVQEISVPEKYDSPPVQTVEVTGNATVTLSFVNRIKRSGLTIYKTVEGDSAVSGFEFKITGPSYPAGTIITTDSSGMANLSDLIPGTYNIEEINVPEEYCIPEPQSIVITATESGTVYFNNCIKRGALRIEKAVNDNTALAGYKFKISGPSYPSGTTVETDSSGAAVLSDLIPGEYTVHELDVPVRYTAPEDQTITIVAEDTITVTFLNALRLGSLRLVKNLSDGGDLAGFEFSISGPSFPDGKSVITGGSGVIVLENLVPGDYTIQEINVPDVYVQPEQQIVSVPADQIAEVSVTNDLKRSRLMIHKSVDDDGTLEGFRFVVTGPSFPEGETFTTDTQGTIRVEDILPGDYRIEEIDVPEKYNIPAPQQVNVGQEEDSTVSFTNLVKRGSLVVVKTVNDDALLDGFEFDINGPSYPAGITITTDDSGEAHLNDLIPGEYTVQEINIPTRYQVLSAQKINVSAENTAVANVCNFLREGSLTITKTLDDGGNPAGFEFRVEGPSHPEGIVVVSDNHGAACLEGLIPGKYSITEINVPVNYYPPDTQIIQIDPGQKCTASFVNRLRTTSITVHKVDADNRGESLGQGDATTEGAEYSLFSKDGILLQTRSIHSGTAVFENVTVGEYYFKETKALPGYHISGETVPFIVSDADFDNSSDQKEFFVADEVVRGGIAIQKRDRETLQRNPLGGGSFAGTEISVTNVSVSPVFYKGKEYQPGQIVTVLVTDENGSAATGNMDLPYGTYVLKEVKAPEGYSLNEDWSAKVRVEEEGVIVEAEPLYDYVMRHDIRFQKVHEVTMDRMALIPFRVTSKSTGESHIIVTDVNGIFDSSLYDHSTNTNTNDEAIREDGTVDETRLDPSYGVWFSGNRVQHGAVTIYGAFPFDTYTFEELPVSGNEDVQMVQFDVTMYQDISMVDIGTILDHILPICSIKTVLTDNDTRDHVAYAGDNTTLIDAVTYTGLNAGREYALRGKLVDTEDHNIIAETSLIFIPESAAGTQNVVFSFDASMMEGRTAVAVQTLEENGKELLVEENLENESQTVHFPHIMTTARSETDSHMVMAAENAVITDTVSYSNLIPFITYRLSGLLTDAETGDPVINSDGSPVTAEKTFIPKKEEGTVDVFFQFDASALAGKKLVAYEELSRNGVIIAEHKDRDDSEQSVVIPGIRTSATTRNGGKTATPDDLEGTLTINDVITYQNLIPGETYRISGSLIDKKDGSIICSSLTGAAYMVDMSFTPEYEDGAIELVFEIDTLDTQGKTIVVFESLLYDGNEVAAHKDINDISQTIEVPYLVKIRKYDAASCSGLGGAVFEVRDNGLAGDPDEYCELMPTVRRKSDKNGYVSFGALAGHEYSIKEVSPPDKYFLDTGEHLVVVGMDGTITGNTEIPNIKGGTVVITKTDAITGLPISGCEITIYREHEAVVEKEVNGIPFSEKEMIRDLVFSQITDEEGRIYFYTDIPGIYVFKETKTVSGYYLNTDEYQFCLDERLAVTGDVNITNAPFGTVVITKTDSGGIRLQGAEISIYNESDQYLGNGISDERGRVYFVSPGPGRYYFVETKAPRGYVMSDERHYFTIAPDYTIYGAVALINKSDGTTGYNNSIGRTGDENDVMLWIFAACISVTLAGTAAVFAIRKKRKSHD